MRKLLSDRESALQSEAVRLRSRLAQVEQELEQLAMEDPKEWTIEELPLNVRPYNCLRSVGIETVGDLCQLSRCELRRIKNLGSKSLLEIEQMVADCGLALASVGSQP